MKRFLAVVALILILAMPVFAGGANEWAGVIGGAGTGAVSGAALGSFIPGLGTAVGAIIGAVGGAIVGGLSGHAADKQQKANDETRVLRTNEMYQDQYVSAKQNYDANYVNYDNALIGLKQSEANIDAYDQALMRWNDQYDIGLGQIQRQGEADYRTVMGNYAGQAYVNAMTGQSGGTADVLAKQQRDQVVSLVGNDLRLDSEGGTYGTQLREYDLDTKAQFEELVQNREIELMALDKNRSETAKYGEELKESKEDLEEAAKQYYQHGDEKYDKYMQQARADVIEDVPEYKANEDVEEEIQKQKKNRRWT